VESANSIADGMQKLATINVVSRSRCHAASCLTCGSSFTRAHLSCPSCGAALAFGRLAILQRDRQPRRVPRLSFFWNVLHGHRVRHTV
jgi:ribosomal protein L32